MIENDINMNYRSISVKIKEELCDELERYAKMRGYDSLASYMKYKLFEGYVKDYPKMIIREIKKRERLIVRLNEKHGVKDAMIHTGSLYHEIQMLEVHRKSTHNFLLAKFPSLARGELMIASGAIQSTAVKHSQINK